MPWAAAIGAITGIHRVRHGLSSTDPAPATCEGCGAPVRGMECEHCKRPTRRPAPAPEPSATYTPSRRPVQDIYDDYSALDSIRRSHYSTPPPPSYSPPPPPAYEPPSCPAPAPDFSSGGGGDFGGGGASGEF